MDESKLRKYEMTNEDYFESYNNLIFLQKSKKIFKSNNNKN